MLDMFGYIFGSTVVGLYGPQLVLVASLGAITIYRREMSCNHCYADDNDDNEDSYDDNEDNYDDNGNGNEKKPSSDQNNIKKVNNAANNDSSVCTTPTWEEHVTEELLDAVGLYWSGSSLAIMVSPLMNYYCIFDSSSKTDNNNKKKNNNQPICGAIDHPQTKSPSTSGEERRSFKELTGSSISGFINNNFASASLFGWTLSSSSSSLSVQKPPKQSSIDTSNMKQTNSAVVGTKNNSGNNMLTNKLPPDAQIHILSFLNPNEICNFACTSKAARLIVDGDETTTTTGGCCGGGTTTTTATSQALWKTLWHRDYAWVVQSWNVGRQALERSQQDSSFIKETMFSKTFYFRFGLSYMNYVLAGQNTLDRCLVGLYGHIYDLSGFLRTHPGSPETVMVLAGREATAFFKNVRHTKGALRLAQSMCVVIDQSKIISGNNGKRASSSCCGLRPTPHTVLLQQDDDTTASAAASRPTSMEHGPLEDLHNSGQGISTLHSALVEFRQQEAKYQQLAAKKCPEHAMLTRANVFFDAFQNSWKAWYTNTNLETVMISLNKEEV